MSFSSEKILPYVSIARIDHWFKNVFIVPGIVIAAYVDHGLCDIWLLIHAVAAIFATCLIASSYYVLNEILDAKSDAMHPLKKHRAVPSGKIKVSVAYAESAILVICGLMVAYSLNMRVLLVSLILCVMALVYNVRPIRAKDQPYVDVLSESVNNPLRLAIGWYCTGIDVLPPASLVAAYWMVGAFFMAVKRFAEYRRINDPERAIMYRQSFKHYNEQRLLVSITYYGVAFGLFFGIFLTRYKMELILSIPLIAGFIAWYIHLGFLPDSPTQSPERLFKRKWFTAYACLCIVVMCGLLFSDIPVVEKTFVPTIPTQSLLPAQK